MRFAAENKLKDGSFPHEPTCEARCPRLGAALITHTQGDPEITSFDCGIAVLRRKQNVATTPTGQPYRPYVQLVVEEG